VAVLDVKAISSHLRVPFTAYPLLGFYYGDVLGGASSSFAAMSMQ